MRRRFAAGIVGAILSASVFVVDAPPAAACSCAGPTPPEQRIGRAEVAFVGRAVSTRPLEGATDEDYFGDEWTVEVLRTYKGRLGQTVEFVTHNDYDGEDSGDCGGAHFLPGDEVAVLASRVGGGGPLRASFGSCSPTATEAELRARADLPPPTGTGPTAALVAARDRDATLLAVNADREIVAYGFGAGDTWLAVACPGHEYFLTIDDDGAVWRWNAATLESTPLARPDEERYGMWRGAHSTHTFSCTTRDGSEAIALWPPEPENAPAAVALAVSSEGVAPIAVEPDTLALVPETRDALTVVDDEVVLIGLGSDERRALGRLPAGFSASAGGVTFDGSYAWLGGTRDGQPGIIAIDLGTGTLGSLIPTAHAVDRNTISTSPTQIVVARSSPNGDNWSGQRVDLDTGIVSDSPVASWRMSSFGEGSIVVGSSHFVESGRVVVEADGSSTPLFPNIWNVEAAFPFAGPEVTAEAAARLHALDVDLSATASEIEIGLDPSPNDGRNWTPVAIGGAAAGVGAVALFAIRRRRRPIAA